MTTRPVIRGNRHAVSSRKPQASQAAERILHAGGNAFDAAVAAQAVLAVTDPAMNGIGGDAYLLVYDARAKKVLSINAGGTAPRLATIEWYGRNAGGRIPVNDGLLCASLPGVVAAWHLLLDGWGTMTFRELLQPAIELAEKGFPVSEYLGGYLVEHAHKLRKYATSAKIYLPNGELPQPGANLRNPDLARALQALVEAEDEAAASERRAALRAARDRFYSGDIARTMARFSEEQGGLYRYEDFAAYEARIEDPVLVNYRGYDVFANPSANQGPTLLMLLNLLEGFDLAARGQNSIEYIHLAIEAAKLAYADREYLADMDFVRVPYEILLSKDYARRRRELIDRVAASHELRPGGVAEGLPPLPARANLAGAADHHGDTSYVAVVDRERNAVSFTPSLHAAFGTGVVMGELGFILNCRGDYYEMDAAHPNALVPGKRPRSTLAPTMVTKDGALFLVLGSPGGDDQILRMLQTFVNIVDFGMNVQEAIEAPRWSTTSFPASEFPHTMCAGQVALESRIPGAIGAELQSRGHKVEMKEPWVMNASCAILIDPVTGVLHAGADPRGDSYALAW